MVGHLRLTSMRPLEKSGLRWTFCDRQPSVQSLCSVRVEGNYNGPWEETHRGSFFRAKGQMVFSIWDHTQYTMDLGLAPQPCYMHAFFRWEHTLFINAAGAHLLIATVLFSCFVYRLRWPFCSVTKRELSKTLAP